ncbi:hypothetical protein B0J18DRAFT_439377 [Chaetomium sp. MPI-SDFR-AT-0129]|nr:hypothetical protein B0J18DRAFT_439377 [Chaetomium sp. MPI-SDFR-AT-0129]
MCTKCWRLSAEWQGNSLWLFSASSFLPLFSSAEFDKKQLRSKAKVANMSSSSSARQIFNLINYNLRNNSFPTLPALPARAEPRIPRRDFHAETLMPKTRKTFENPARPRQLSPGPSLPRSRRERPAGDVRGVCLRAREHTSGSG